MLGSFLPNALDVQLCGGDNAPFVIWNPHAKEEDTRGRHAGWARALAEDSGSEATGRSSDLEGDGPPGDGDEPDAESAAPTDVEVDAEGSGRELLLDER